jgi:epidermal growth factor receptor substrate 15
MLLGQDALPLMTKSNLPQQTLGEIWALSDPDNNGFLTKESWYRAARIIGWLQKGGKTTVEESLLHQGMPIVLWTPM